MVETQCRHFSGYKPCGLSATCSRGSCAYFESVQTRVLVVHLEAIGAVLRSTSLVPAIKRKFAKSHITWVTKAPAHQLIRGVAGVDRVLTLSNEDLLQLEALSFDVALVIDKSLTASGVLRRVRVADVFGFRTNESGSIVPATGEAIELWQLGLSNHQKFFVNKKTEQQLVHEALALGDFQRDEYQVNLSLGEISEVLVRRQKWSPQGRPVLGINTGCSDHVPARKFTVEGHRKLIAQLQKDSRFRDMPIVLLGGPEESRRNEEIARGLNVIVSPTLDGLRDGLLSVGACDVVISGDSLGMHMAIALKKWVVAWFGPTCQQEIDLYGRGEKILTQAACSPCWKRSCDKPLMCYDQVDHEAIANAVARGVKNSAVIEKPVLFSGHGQPVLSDRISW